MSPKVSLAWQGPEISMEYVMQRPLYLPRSLHQDNLSRIRRVLQEDVRVLHAGLDQNPLLSAHRAETGG